MASNIITLNSYTKGTSNIKGEFPISTEDPNTCYIKNTSITNAQFVSDDAGGGGGGGGLCFYQCPSTGEWFECFTISSCCPDGTCDGGGGGGSWTFDNIPYFFRFFSQEVTKDYNQELYEISLPIDTYTNAAPLSSFYNRFGTTSFYDLYSIGYLNGNTSNGIYNDYRSNPFKTFTNISVSNFYGSTNPNYLYASYQTYLNKRQEVSSITQMEPLPPMPLEDYVNTLFKTLTSSRFIERYTEVTSVGGYTVGSTMASYLDPSTNSQIDKASYNFTANKTEYFDFVGNLSSKDLFGTLFGKDEFLGKTAYLEPYWQTAIFLMSLNPNTKRWFDTSSESGNFLGFYVTPSTGIAYNTIRNRTIGIGPLNIFTGGCQLASPIFGGNCPFVDSSGLLPVGGDNVWGGDCPNNAYVAVHRYLTTNSITSNLKNVMKLRKHYYIDYFKEYADAYFTYDYFEDYDFG